MVNKNVFVARQSEEYDAIVVGSGISGGYAAKELCELGWSFSVWRVCAG